MSEKEHYFDFHVGDWLKDHAVSSCTPATRGVWFDLLCAMHEAGRTGELSKTRDQLARLGRCSAADLALALTDLQTTGAADISERNGVVTVVNRRMRRKAQDRESTRLRVAKYRADSRSNDDVTPKMRDGPMGNGNPGLESFFSGELPIALDTPDFRKALQQWLDYKSGRKQSYKPTGLAAMVSRASKLASLHGVAKVIDAMERAMANGWQGWDQPTVFDSVGGKNGKHSGPGPGQRYAGD